MTNISEDAGKLRSVIRIIRGQCQRVQPGNGGIGFAEFRFDLGEMAPRWRVTGHTTLRGLE